MRQIINIGRRRVGEGYPAYIIAEAGSNHNGDLSQAFALIDVAVNAGADAVKFQNFRAETLYPKDGSRVGYLKRLGIDLPIFELIKKMEMPLDWIPIISKYCKNKGIDFLSTPFDEEAVDRLNPYVPAFKIASYEITHLPLLKKVARCRKPVILSTGAATEAEIANALAVLRREGAKEVALLQCTAKYPAPLETVQARAMLVLKKRFNVVFGLSDHSRDPIVAPVVARALGASIIEKHFTLSNKLPGPDHTFAVQPEELALLVKNVRAAEEVLGKEEKLLQFVEKELVNYRRAVFLRKKLKAGVTMGSSDLVILRRTGGKKSGIVLPKDYSSVIGKKLKRPKEANECLCWNDLTG